MKKALACLVCLLACSPIFAQSNITMELKDAPIRSTLEMVFKQGGIKNYVIDNSVSGFVTMNLTDQPFENALKLVMRANTVPLLYKKENDVWIVEQRKITLETKPTPDLTNVTPQNNQIFEVIHLNHIDPFDLQMAFGFILNVNQFQRFGSMGNMGGFGGQGNGMGGMGGGMMGGGMGNMGGFSGGMGGNMGGMGGMMGGMGMGGGMGGFGGGRNF